MNAVPETMTQDWHVVQTKPRLEARAQENLLNQGFDVFLPMLRQEKVRRGRLQVVIEPLFSRYLFLRLSPQSRDISVVRSSRGVSHLVRFGVVPATVPDAWVAAMRAQPPEPIKKMFQAGDAVTLVDGPLKGLRALYLEEDGEARSMILIELLNQTHRLGYETMHMVPNKDY